MTRVVDIRVAACEAPQGLSPIEIWRPFCMHATGTLIPERVNIRWEKINGEPWELVRLNVNGPRIKKDGEVGLTGATTHFVDLGRTLNADRPGWLQDIVDRLAPQ